MRVLLTGATGSIGRRLVQQLCARGDEVLAVTRDRKRAADLVSLPSSRLLGGDPTIPGTWQDAVAGADAVVHLACAGLSERADSAEDLESLRERRLDGMFQVVTAIEKSANRPHTLVVVSNALASSTEGSQNPVVALHKDLEAEAARATQLGVRVVFLRLGLLMDETGQGLETLVGADSSEASVRFIHAADASGMIAWTLAHEAVVGAVSCWSSAPVTVEQSKALLPTTRRRVPRGELRVLLGSRFDALKPTTFSCQFNAFEDVVRDLVGTTKPAAKIAEAKSNQPSHRAIAVLPCEGFLLDGMALHVNAGRAVASLRDAGISVILATSCGGKIPFDLAARVGTNAPIIAGDGSVLLDPRLGEAIRTESLRADRVSAIATAIRTADPRVTIIVERGVHVGSETDGVPPEPLRGLTSIDEVVDTQTLFGRPATRLLVHAPARRLNRALEVIRSSWWREQLVGIIEYAPDVVSITAPTADRGVALQRAESVMGVARGSSIVLAATERDAGLLECTDVGLALPTLAPRFAKSARKALATSDPAEVADAIVRTHLARVVRAVPGGR